LPDTPRPVDDGAMQHLVVAGACLVALSLAPLQERPKPAAPTLSQEQVLDSVQGAWRLRKIEDKNLPTQGRQEAGYLVVSGSHAAIEIHVGYTLLNGTLGDPEFQSGIYAATVDAERKLVLNTLIGMRTDRSIKAIAEPVGQARKFSVEAAGAMLTLRREDGAAFHFDKLQDKSAKLDFYGRPVGEKPAGGK
jgi:hypothetical protein